MIWVEPNSERWLNLEDLPGEEWKDIKDFEDLYQVSNYGRVKRLKKVLKSYILHHDTNTLKEKICRCQLKRNKYLGVVLTKDNKKYNKQIHRLVAQAFIPNPENKPYVNHIKPVTQQRCDNRANNLEWCTRSENIRWMLELGRGANGSEHRLYASGKEHCNAKKIFKINTKHDIVKTYDTVQCFIQDMPFGKWKCHNVLKYKIEIEGYLYIYESDYKQYYSNNRTD